MTENNNSHIALRLTCLNNHTDIIELLTDKFNKICIVCKKPL
jgi:hypothetical protein